MNRVCTLPAVGLAASASLLLSVAAHAADTASRLDSAAATSTLQVIDREMIEGSGKFSLAELLRDLPLNSTGSPRPRFGTDAQTYAGVDLRGLGTERTLVLVNGKREAIAPDTATGSNLNLIPLAMVERIEILPSGAGAIHGMNAMGGVVNIVTRDEFRGVEASAGTSWSEREGGEVEGASVLAGVGGERGSIVVGASYDEREIVFARDRAWSDGDTSIFANNFLTRGFAFLGDGAANEEGCRGAGFSIVDGLCRYDLALDAADEVATRNESLFANARYRVGDDWTIGLDARVGRLETFQPRSAVASSPWPANGFGAVALQPGSPNHPATPPSAGGLNPAWQDYAGVADEPLLNLHRFAANGSRDAESEAVQYAVSLDARGRIGRFDVSLSAHRAEIQHDERIDNLVLSQLAQAAIDAGAYNLYDPSGTSDDVLESFEATGARDANYLLRSLHGSIATDLLDLPGGTARGLIGVELRDERFDDRPDALRSAGVVTGSTAQPYFGERGLWAAFGELTLPVTERLDALAAVRWDDYDYTGSGTSARLAVDWRLLDRLGFHAAWSRSLRAEPLRQGPDGPPGGGFQVGPPTDDRSCEALGLPPGCGIAFPRFDVRNPDLGPESIEQIDLGLRYSPLEGFELAVSAFDIRIEDRLVRLGDQRIIDCLNGTGGNCPGGLATLDPVDMPPDPSAGLGVARDPSGLIRYIQTGLVGFGRIETRGIDARLAGRWRIGEVGVSSAIDATWIERYRIDDGADRAGEAGRPDWRGRWQTNIDWRDFDLTWIVNHIDGQDLALDGSGALPSWTTHDVQLRWSAPWNADVAIGIDNLTDRDPVLDRGEPAGFNFALYDGYGRLGYLRYVQRF
ncbi:TonB-dependent receptor [Wenzhouxiangella sp. XN79A]|uniref:TonB-dependent receptor domain-containing protein n=1 Tax=Wenzhouxiangella sp. XN79A TaxID=2724193 RepID=UPI00144A8C9C|nr:TonB-dependent receptor [Wenzhouxiangella sp. XN79A]NKI36621.1 TonB-dependent receptor [Wenzhouxiangella sp. XN79A]